MENLGLLLEAARVRRGYTQTAFADSIGMTQSKYSRLERVGRGGMKELPPPEDLRLISDALGLSMEEMLIAAGYLEVPSTDQGDVIMVRATDPRARVVAALDGLPDHAVNQWVVAIEALTNAGSANAKRDVRLPDNAEQSKTA